MKIQGKGKGRNNSSFGLKNSPVSRFHFFPFTSIFIFFPSGHFPPPLTHCTLQNKYPRSNDLVFFVGLDSDYSINRIFCPPSTFAWNLTPCSLVCADNITENFHFTQSDETGSEHETILLIQTFKPGTIHGRDEVIIEQF